jgi:hypothetical protein
MTQSRLQILDILALLTIGFLLGLWMGSSQKQDIILIDNYDKIEQLEKDSSYLKDVPSDSVYNNIIRYIERAKPK